MGATRRSFTCFLSSCFSQWSEVLNCIITTHQQYLFQENITKKINRTLRAIMIYQDVVLVAGDFNGTAWRCCSRDNLSTVAEVVAHCALLES